MTAKRKITDKNGVQVFPITHTKAVLDDNGNSVEQRLQENLDLINQKQLEVGAVPSDITPTEGSTNWVTSGGIHTALQPLNNCKYEIAGVSTEVGISDNLVNQGATFKSNTKRIVLAKSYLIEVTNISELFSIGLSVPFSAISDVNIDRVMLLFYNASKSNLSTISPEWDYFGEQDVDVSFDVRGNDYANVKYVGIQFGGQSADISPEDVDYSQVHFVFTEKAHEVVDAVDEISFNNTKAVVEANAEKLYSDDIAWKTLTNDDAVEKYYKTVIAGDGTTQRKAYLIDVRNFDNFRLILTPINPNVTLIVMGWDGETIQSQRYNSGTLTNNEDFNVTKEEMGDVRYIVIYTNSATLSFSSFKRIAQYSLLYTDEQSVTSRLKSLEGSVFGEYGFEYSGERIRLNGNSFNYEKLGQLQASGDNTTRQGGAVYGDYLFQFHNTLGKICVYNLRARTSACIITLTANPNCHAAGGGFSNTFYSSNDLFPLLYVSSWTEKKIYVYRITGTLDNLTAALVQTITLSTDYYLLDCCLDNELGKLVIFGYTQNTSSNPSNNNCVFLRCNIPSYTTDVTLSEFDEFTLPFIYAHQGGFARNGKLYLSYGDTRQQLGGGLYVIDYVAGTIRSHVDLSYIGGFEPEACCRWGHHIIITNGTGNIYSLTF